MQPNQSITHQATANHRLRYYTALPLVRNIDAHLEDGTCHYRNRAGVLLTTLDEVVRAAMEDDLLEDANDIEDDLDNHWLCECGNYIEDGCHCRMCQREPPWGCPCSWCQDERHYQPEDDYYPSPWDN